MKNKFEFNYVKFSHAEDLNPEEQNLYKKAKTAAINAYAPYSGFMVGASVLLENGVVITGNNQENAAYPSGMCAERTALFYAGSSYPEIPVKTILITAFSSGKFLDNAVSPCGGCRQVILEIIKRQKKPIRLIMAGESVITILEDASLLLPFPFENPF